MKKEDLKIIKKVISEEGMKKEIGALIDFHHPAAPVGKVAIFSNKLIIGLIVLTAAISLSVFGYKHYNKDAKNTHLTANVETETNMSNLVNDDNSSIEELTSNPNDSNNSNLIKKDIKSSKKVNSISTKELNLGGRNTASNRGVSENKTINKPLFRLNNKKSSFNSSLGMDELSKEKKEVTNGSFKTKGNEGKNSISKESSKTKDKNNNFTQTTTNNKEPSSPSDSIKRDDKKEVADYPLDSLEVKNDKDSSATHSNNDKQSKWEVKLGLGYGFLSTGDINSVNLHNEITYQFAPRWKAGFETSFGRSTTDPVVENTSYIQNGLNIYFSPLKKSSKFQFNIGTGPSFYALNRSYRQTVSIINGQPQYEYFSEKRNDFGLGLIIENRYYFSETVSLGARLNTHQYLQGDAISGFNINLGIKF